MSKILIVVTSVDEYAARGYRTGLWLGELTHFWDVAERAGHDLTIASIAGGDVPLDPESLNAVMLAMGGTGKRYRDREFMNLLRDTLAISEVHAADFDAVYLTGGHGTMFDFPQSTALAGLLGEMYGSGKIVSAVCHGPAGLLKVRDASGDLLLRGRTVTGFSFVEEIAAGRKNAVPFKLEDALREAGATYRKARVPMASHVEVDDRLITGQNPTSAKAVATEVCKQLDSRASI